MRTASFALDLRAVNCDRKAGPGGTGEPDGNKGSSCRRAPPSPQAFNIGPLDITVQQRRVLYLRHRDAYRFEHSSGRVRSLKATALRCLEASYPSGRELSQPKIAVPILALWGQHIYYPREHVVIVVWSALPKPTGKEVIADEIFSRLRRRRFGD